MILREIINKRGIDVLSDNRTLGSILADLLNLGSKESRILQLAVREGISSRFIEIASEDASNRRNLIYAVYEDIIDNMGLANDKAAYIVNAFSFAIGAGEKEFIHADYESGDYKSGLSDDRRTDDINEESPGENASRLYRLGIDYIEGKVVQRDYKCAASYFRKGIDVNPLCELELGKLYFYGWGVRQDIRKAIKCFEQYLNRTCESDYINSSDNKKIKADPILEKRVQSHIRAIINAVPFLIQAYYEDLILTGSMRSLEKLCKYADMHGFRMAQRYLLRYYADTDNAKKNSFMAEKYTGKLLKNRENPYVMSIKAWGGIANLDAVIRVSTGLYLYSTGQSNEAMVSLRNHLILGEEVNESGNEDSGSLAYYLMGMILSERMDRENNRINSLRAEIYLKNYLEIVSEDEHPDNYSQALMMYGRHMLNYSPKSGKWKSADYIAEMADKISGQSLGKEKMLKSVLDRVKYYGSRGESAKALMHLEKAVEYGYRDDYSIIGIMYLNGEDGLTKDNDKGYYWLNRFYTEYTLNRLNPDIKADISVVEYYLSQCYEMGLGTKVNHELAHELFIKAAEHGNAEAKKWLNFCRMLEAV